MDKIPADILEEMTRLHAALNDAMHTERSLLNEIDEWRAMGLQLRRRVSEVFIRLERFQTRLNESILRWNSAIKGEDQSGEEWKST